MLFSVLFLLAFSAFSSSAASVTRSKRESRYDCAYAYEHANFKGKKWRVPTSSLGDDGIIDYHAINKISSVKVTRHCKLGVYTGVFYGKHKVFTGSVSNVGSTYNDNIVSHYCICLPP